MTVGEWVRLAELRLSISGVESARLEAQVLAGHVLRVDRSWLLAHPEHEFPELAGEQVLQRRETHEPLAYILGYREFYGREFGVDPQVLIPRQETEILVETALKYGDAPVTTVLDMGTGSGVLAVTLKLEQPEWNITAVDVSADALAVASANARFHNASVRFVLSDGFEGLLGECFDLIVSNPPYIAESDPLPPEVANHEPAAALWPGPTGFEFYERLCKQAPAHLDEGGVLAMEVGHTQAERVAEMFVEAGWRIEDTVNDLSGVARVVVARWFYES